MTTLHELGKVLHDIRCRHGEAWGGRYCERCTVEQDQRIAAAYRAGQAMHHLMVWTFCQGTLDHGQFLFANPPRWTIVRCACGMPISPTPLPGGDVKGWLVLCPNCQKRAK